MSPRQRFAGLHPNLQGAAWMVAAATVFSINGVLVKELAAGGLSFWQVAFARAFFALLPLLPFVWRNGAAAFRTTYPATHLLRALFGAGAMTAGFYALSRLPLALVTAIGFTSPLFTIVLSALVLRELVRWRRWSATAIGFLGMLVMVRPGGAGFDPAMLAAVGMALGTACAVILVKRFPKGESQTAMLVWFCVTSILTSAGPAVHVWQDPTAVQWLLLVGVGVVGVAAQAMIVNAYRTGEASFVASFDYSRLLGAAVLGFAFFAEVPDLYTLLGAAIIVGSSLYIAHREAQLGKQAPPATVVGRG
ncbi:Permease of the drug/metabolite transporter (DMT) superfamily [Tistlia consotensis]|uniref:Permease of the drug/metabolite transporter (DMT) superfamily n=1 Tax=Tistlia consotensis USBA 355 TaxID=560819 RepID=A0A1Y6C7K7_9PROT|nr:DMT family transporter [Tistlia consotensis]SMF38631.1 Permease of the drug/metabolite transporter (DMT) superfamily [Tistlia consotensis USBA 355]SNR36971.1 Permease of the drug/metabolite transporter (DMT) superfamily [Tistlia consotensis]